MAYNRCRQEEEREEPAVFSIREMAPSGGWMNEWRMQMLQLLDSVFKKKNWKSFGSKWYPSGGMAHSLKITLRPAVMGTEMANFKSKVSSVKRLTHFH